MQKMPDSPSLEGAGRVGHFSYITFTTTSAIPVSRIALRSRQRMISTTPYSPPPTTTPTEKPYAATAKNATKAPTTSGMWRVALIIVGRGFMMGRL